MSPTGEKRIMAFVLKITPDDFARSPRLQATLEALRAFDHPHAVRLLASAVEQDHLVLVFELFDAHTLRRRMKEGPRFTEAQAREWVRQIREACAAAHAVGLFHGDLDAKHVILTTDGAAKLVGVGESQIREHDPRSEDTTAPRPSRFSAESDMAAIDRLAAQMMRKALPGGGAPRSDLN